MKLDKNLIDNPHARVALMEIKEDLTNFANLTSDEMLQLKRYMIVDSLSKKCEWVKKEQTHIKEYLGKIAFEIIVTQLRNVEIYSYPTKEANGRYTYETKWEIKG